MNQLLQNKHDRIRVASVVGRIAVVVFLIGFVIGTKFDYDTSRANGASQQILDGLLATRVTLFIFFAPISVLVYLVFNEFARTTLFGSRFVRLLKVMSWLSLLAVGAGVIGLFFEGVSAFGLVFLVAGMAVLPAFFFCLMWLLEIGGLLRSEMDLTV
ncbi:MAG: hypothetical protein AAGA58_18245 [Verrucomicrobiota bacterium]